MSAPIRNACTPSLGEATKKAPHLVGAGLHKGMRKTDRLIGTRREANAESESISFCATSTKIEITNAYVEGCVLTQKEMSTKTRIEPRKGRSVGIDACIRRTEKGDEVACAAASQIKGYSNIERGRFGCKFKFLLKEFPLILTESHKSALTLCVAKP